MLQCNPILMLQSFVNALRLWLLVRKWFRLSAWFRCFASYLINACKVCRSAVFNQNAGSDTHHLKTLMLRMAAMMPPDVKESLVDEMSPLPVLSDIVFKQAIFLVDGVAMLFQRQVHDLMIRDNYVLYPMCDSSQLKRSQVFMSSLQRW